MGELLGLRRTDLDLAERQIHVCRTLRKGGPNPEFADTPKSDAGDRIIPIAKDLVPVLQAQRIRQSEERLLRGPTAIVQ